MIRLGSALLNKPLQLTADPPAVTTICARSRRARPVAARRQAGRRTPVPAADPPRPETLPVRQRRQHPDLGRVTAVVARGHRQPYSPAGGRERGRHRRAGHRSGLQTHNTEAGDGAVPRPPTSGGPARSPPQQQQRRRGEEPAPGPSRARAAVQQRARRLLGSGAGLGRSAPTPTDSRGDGVAWRRPAQHAGLFVNLSLSLYCHCHHVLIR